MYVDRLPPCNDACPAGENIQQWLYLAEDGSYEAAWRQIMRDNPLPAVMGRACFHPCQTACNRADGRRGGGHQRHRALPGRPGPGRGLAARRCPPGDGQAGPRRRVGPGGLTAAYHLRLLGHEVVVYESSPLPGGMMRYGIPAYRLPRDVVAGEIDRIGRWASRSCAGGRSATSRRGDQDGGFDAAFLAVGAQRGRHADIPAGDSARILDAVTLLREHGGSRATRLGRRVVVYGGGDTAMDAARTARRLGAEEAVVVYRRTREPMPANLEEVADAVAEGVRAQVALHHRRRRRRDIVRIERMELDDRGFPQPTGEFEELRADALVLGAGAGGRSLATGARCPR